MERTEAKMAALSRLQWAVPLDSVRQRKNNTIYAQTVRSLTRHKSHYYIVMLVFFIPQSPNLKKLCHAFDFKSYI